MSKKLRETIKVKVGAGNSSSENYTFLLFITGILPNSARAIINTKTICEKYLKGKYKLEIIDIYQQPDLAIRENIIAIPTLIKKFPLPEIRLIGDMSDTKRVLEELSLFN